MADKKSIIKASTPNSKKYDTKIDIYTNDPKEDHKTIHIAVNSDNKSAHIIDTTTTNKKEKHTDVQCYLTTACMRYFQEEFDDDCFELTILRWFRDKFVSKEDIKYYYKVAPIIVETINKEEKQNDIYEYIYNNIINYCIEQIKQGNYNAAYNRYKNSVLTLEEHFARPALTNRLIKVLKYQN